jgi:hypothetical protein
MFHLKTNLSFRGVHIAFALVPKHSVAEIRVVSAMAKFQQLGISESHNPPQGHQSKPSEEPIPVGHRAHIACA